MGAAGKAMAGTRPLRVSKLSSLIIQLTMEHIAVTLQDLDALVELIGAFTAAPCAVKGFEKLLGSLRSVVPFEHCLLLHERRTAAGAMTYRREYASRYGAAACEVHAGADRTSIEPYLEHVVKTCTLENAFLWTSKDSMSCATPILGARFPERLSSRRGVGASISSGGADESDQSVTLLLLQQAEEVPGAKHLAVMNAIVRPTHEGLRNSVEFPGEPSSFGNLTAQEAKVMRWVVEGKTSWEVGMILSISERTVKFHLANIYAKLKVANRVQAVSLFSRANNIRVADAA
jgi:LuxR family quorum-sensing system transcriptional regulator SolR